MGFVDSEYEGDLVDRRSITDEVFSLASAPICWISMLQPLIAMFTTKVEYIFYG